MGCPVRAHATLAYEGSVKKFPDPIFSVTGRSKLEIYNTTPFTLGSSKRSICKLSLKTNPDPFNSPTTFDSMAFAGGTKSVRSVGVSGFGNIKADPKKSAAETMAVPMNLVIMILRFSAGDSIFRFLLCCCVLRGGAVACNSVVVLVVVATTVDTCLWCGDDNDDDDVVKAAATPRKATRNSLKKDLIVRLVLFILFLLLLLA